MTILSYPLQLDGNGNLKVSSDLDRIRDLIWSFIETLPGENPMRPTYGTPSPVFDTQNDWNSYIARLQTKLTEEIPEGDFAINSTIFDDGSSGVDIFYSLQGNQQETISVAFI